MIIELIIIYILSMFFIYCSLRISSNISRQEEIEEINQLIENQ